MWPHRVRGSSLISPLLCSRKSFLFSFFFFFLKRNGITILCLTSMLRVVFVYLFVQTRYSNGSNNILEYYCSCIKDRLQRSLTKRHCTLTLVKMSEQRDILNRAISTAIYSLEQLEVDLFFFTLKLILINNSTQLQYNQHYSNKQKCPPTTTQHPPPQPWPHPQPTKHQPTSSSSPPKTSPYTVNP